MTKFQKSAIILGAIYLVMSLVGYFLGDIILTSEFVRAAYWSVVNTIFPLLLLFNALQHKSSTAKTAVVIGGVFWVLCICANILSAIGHYYIEQGCYDVYGLYFGIANIVSFIASVAAIISIGYFADSLRKNIFVLIASVIYMITILFVLFADDLYYGLLYGFIGYDWGEVYVYLSYIPILIATCLFFASAATVTDKKPNTASTAEA